MIEQKFLLQIFSYSLHFLIWLDFYAVVQRGQNDQFTIFVANLLRNL